MLVLTVVVVIVPDDLNIEATPGGGGGDEEYTLLNNSYIRSITEKLSYIVNDTSIYPPGTLPKGREIGFSGIALDDMILKVGVSSPETHKYTIIGGDDYQKTVSWKNLKNGVLTEEKRVAFSDLPKAFRVRDVVEIKVT